MLREGLRPTETDWSESRSCAARKTHAAHAPIAEARTLPLTTTRTTTRTGPDWPCQVKTPGSYDWERSAAKWLRELVPFYASRDPNRIADCVYRLFGSQVEYCTNLVFERRAALDRLHERLLDLNRSIGHPDKIAIIFGRAALRLSKLSHSPTTQYVRSPVFTSEKRLKPA